MGDDPAQWLSPTLRRVWEAARARYVALYPDRPVPELAETYRDPAAQARAYASGASRARPGASDHNRFPAEAFDVRFRSANGVDWSARQYNDFAAVVRSVDPTVHWGASIALPNGAHDIGHFGLSYHSGTMLGSGTTTAPSTAPRAAAATTPMNRPLQRLLVLVACTLLLFVGLRKVAS